MNCRRKFCTGAPVNPCSCTDCSKLPMAASDAEEPSPIGWPLYEESLDTLGCWLLIPDVKRLELCKRITLASRQLSTCSPPDEVNQCGGSSMSTAAWKS